MKCPKCKDDLHITGEDHLQTLSEHVCDPNGTPSLKAVYQCVNTNCKCFRAFAWNSDGEFYPYGYDSRLVFDNHEMTSALGSFSRKMDIEISHHGLPDKVRLHPALMLWFFQPYIQYRYTADEDGNVLSVRRSLGIFKKDHHDRNRKRVPRREYDNDYRLGAHFCWTTWAYLWWRFKDRIESGKYKSAFRPSFNRAWVYRWFETFVKIRFYSLYKKTIA
mgnify:CR=1 FL=1